MTEIAGGDVMRVAGLAADRDARAQLSVATGPLVRECRRLRLPGPGVDANRAALHRTPGDDRLSERVEVRFPELSIRSEPVGGAPQRSGA